MRPSVSIPILALLLTAACGSADRQAQVPERDLTSTSSNADTREFASPIELGMNRPVPAPEAPAVLPETAEPAALPEMAVLGSLDLVVTGEFTNPPAELPPGIVRRLAPGQTVRIIPTNHPTGVSDEGDEVNLPESRRGLVVRIGGGVCEPRGVGGILF
jgi:hypothetical protein